MVNEKRLIDANVLSDTVAESLHDNPHTPGIIRANHRSEHNHFLRMIYDAPTVDAVEVVRCKDCKHSSCNPVKLTYACNHPLGLRGFLNEGFYFCSYGERRNDGNS